MLGKTEVGNMIIARLEKKKTLEKVVYQETWICPPHLSHDIVQVYGKKVLK